MRSGFCRLRSRANGRGAPGARQKSIAEPGLHPETVMLLIWGDNKGVLLVKPLPPSAIVTAKIYPHELDFLAGQIQRKPRTKGPSAFSTTTPDLTLGHITRQRLFDLDCEVLIYPLYSTNLVTSNYHLFLSLSNHLR